MERNQRITRREILWREHNSWMVEWNSDKSYVVPVRVKETSRRVQVRCRRSRDSNGPFRRNRLEGQPEIIILREYRARILTRYRDARSGNRYVVRRGSIAILPSSKSVSIHCSSSSTRSGRSSRSGKNRIDAGSDAALSVGCGIASTRWWGVSSILSPPSFLSFPILHSSPEDNCRDSFLDNAIYLFIYQWKLARKVL